MSKFTQAKVYANSLGQSLNKCSLEQFFNEIQSKFYSKIKIDFMEYFLEIIDKDGEFVIPHIKLNEYGVVTSTQSTHIKEKLNNLGMLEGEDFTLTDIREQSETSRGVKYSKQYFLTPESFKKCLMRAKRHGQSIDPTIYCDYYILLEKIYKLYSIYQKSYDEKTLSMKDDKIDELSNTVNDIKALNEEQNKKMNEQSKKMDEQSEQIRQLLGHTIEVKKDNKIVKTELVEVKTKLVETNEKLDVTNTELVEVKNELVEVKVAVKETKSLLGQATGMFSNMCSYFKESIDVLFGRNKTRTTTQYCNLLTDKTKIKFQYVVVKHYLNNKARIYIRCTNESNIYATLEKISYFIDEIHVVGIHNEDINYEYKVLKDNYPGFNLKTKSKLVDNYSPEMIDELVALLRKQHTKNFGDSNEFIRMIQVQDRHYMDYLSERVKKIFDMYISRGRLVRPNTRERRLALENLSNDADYVYDNTETIEALVKVHGEEKTLLLMEAAVATLENAK